MTPGRDQAADGIPTSQPIRLRSDSVELVDRNAAPAWNEAVTKLGGSFYHLYEWAEVNKQEFGHQNFYLATRRSQGDIAGVLPLALVDSRLFGRILCSMPFVNFGGPCATDSQSTNSLLDRATKLVDELQADHLELRCTQVTKTDMPVSLRKVSMTIQLKQDPETLWNAFSSKHRTNIRRVYKNGLEVISGTLELLPTFYGLMERAWRDLGTPLYRYTYFERVLKTFPDHTRIFVCHRSGQPIAAAFNGYFNGTVEGMWAAGHPDFRDLQANYVLYWEMIQDACRRGFQRYHLGRSSADSGAEQFKKKWNADSQQLYWYYHMARGDSLPALNVDNPKYRFAISTWRHLPLWTTRLIGPLVARSIP